MNSVPNQNQLLSKVTAMRDIPTLSLVIRQVMDLMSDPKATSLQIAEVMKRDQVLSAKVLRLVNSSFYSRQSEVTDVARALNFLGDNTVSAIVLSTNAFSKEDLQERLWFDIQEFWRYSLACAIASEILARKAGLRSADECFTCGLLHDLGKVALFRADKALMRKVVERSQSSRKSFLDAEQELGLPGHTVLGEKLAEHWKLPLVIRKCIRYHHRDISAMQSIYPDMHPTIMVVSLASFMVQRLGLGNSCDLITAEVPSLYLSKLNLNEEKLKSCEGALFQELRRAEELLGWKSSTLAA